MSVVLQPAREPTGSVPLEETCRRLERENAELQRTQSLVFTILSNSSLQPAERIVAVFTTFAVQHERSKGTVTGEYVPICAKAIATQAGISNDTVGKAIDRLSKFGAWEKPPRELTRPIYSEETEQWATPLVLRPPGSLQENLQTLARLAPTPIERKELTGKGKPGGQPGEKREKIERACPTCGSTNTRLQCLDCGTVTHTDDLISPAAAETEGQQGGCPQVAARIRIGNRSASCGHPLRTQRGQRLRKRMNPPVSSVWKPVAHLRQPSSSCARSPATIRPTSRCNRTAMQSISPNRGR